MSNHDPYRTKAVAATQGTVIDAGLQDYMRGVFNTMGLGLAVTGAVAYAIANIKPVADMIFGTPLYFVAMFAPLAFLWMGFTPARIARMDAGKLRSSFYLFSAMMGVSFAAIFMVFTGESIARTFFITAATFAATGIFGYTTKKDLTGMGSFMMMGAFGIFIAMLVNLFIGSAALHMAVSVIGVVVFTGLAAFEVQRLKETYAYGQGEANAKLAVMGALSLYLSFINLFQFMLSLMGGQRE